MTTIALLAVLVVAVLHVGFMVIEMFLWDKPSGLKIFGHSSEKAAASKVLAANQGLYNGFLAAGLFWGAMQGAAGYEFKLFFLSCVIAAGVFGGFTASVKIFWVQAAPAIAALFLVMAAG